MEMNTERDNDTLRTEWKPRKPLHPKRIEIQKKKTKRVIRNKETKVNRWDLLILKDSSTIDSYFTKFMNGNTTDYMPITKFLKRPTSFFLIEKYIYKT